MPSSLLVRPKVKDKEKEGGGLKQSRPFRTTRFFFKGQSLRDSTERFPEYKGHYTECSTEPTQNKGQLQLSIGSKIFPLKQDWERTAPLSIFFFLFGT